MFGNQITISEEVRTAQIYVRLRNIEWLANGSKACFLQRVGSQFKNYQSAQNLHIYHLTIIYKELQNSWKPMTELELINLEG